MAQKYKVGNGKLILDVIITQEKIEGKTYFVARGIQIDVASQGLSLEEALENIKDAAEIVIEDSDEKKIMVEEERSEIAPMLTRVF